MPRRSLDYLPTLHPANIVTVQNHYGPHPEEYHHEIRDRLVRATEGKRPESATRAFRGELDRIAGEAKTRGTKINDMITRRGAWKPCVRR